MAEKIIIYQLLPRLYTNTCSTCVAGGDAKTNGVGKMKDFNAARLKEIKSLGATHVWYTGVIEHATTTDFSQHGIVPCNEHVVKGKAGSPYAIRDYYDIDPNIATVVEDRVKEWKLLVRRTHSAGLKVVMDFVPNHVAREYSSDAAPAGVEDLGANDNEGMFFSPTNNFFYITGEKFNPSVDMGEGEKEYTEFPARATGNDCYHATPGINDWYETIKLNYGVDPWNGSKHFAPIPPTWHKMLHILMYWAKTGVDAFRCDMAHMVPVEFWHWAIAQVKKQYPNIIFIAEIYDTALYRQYINYGLFDYLYNKVTLYDTLFNVLKYKISARQITQCWQQLDDISDHMLNFLENHDELRLASPQFCGNAIMGRPALVVSATLSRCPMLVYAGQELGERGTDAEGFSGQDGRTTIFDFWSIPSLRKWFTGKSSSTATELRGYYSKVLTMCNAEGAISNGSMFDLMYVNQHLNRQYAYLRHDDETLLLIVANFEDSEANIDINIPYHAFECLNVQQGDYEGVELLAGNSSTMHLVCNMPLRVDIPAHDAVVWKFKLKK